MTDLSSSLLLSVRVTVVATVLTALAGIPLAWCFARWRFPLKSLVEAAITLPLVLPPTVVGFFILMAAGQRSPVGRALKEWLDYSIVFHWHGAVVAAAVVALPLLYLPAKAAFAGVDRELEDVSRLMGANPLQVFWHVSLPMARRGIFSGLLLAFARALGEFGATTMVLGNFAGQRTLPIRVYDDYYAGDLAAATAGVAVLTGISFAIILIYNRSPLDRSE